MGSPQAHTTEELARRAQAGDLECFEEVVRRYQVPLMHFFTNRTGNRHAAEELVQDTFLRVFSGLAQYTTSKPFRPWIFTIAYRLTLDYYRRKRDVTGPVANGIHQTPGPDDLMVQSEERNALWSMAKATLKPEHFTALWLHYAEEMSLEEVAEVLGRTRATVKIMLFRSRRKLSRRLNDWRAEPERKPYLSVVGSHATENGK